MQQIYTEEDLVQSKEISWGQWKYALSKEEINNKLETLPVVEDREEFHSWANLFAIPGNDSPCTADPVKEEIPASKIEVPEIEYSMDIDSEANEVVENNKSVDGVSEDLVISLVDLCNQVAPKLKLGIKCIQEEMSSITEDIHRVKNNLLKSVMLNAWSQLNSDAAKFCFCIPFIANCANNQMCGVLCENILLPWLQKRVPSKLEQLSAILSPDGELVTCRLVAPLLRMEDSSLANDTIALEELMSCMLEKHWTVLLRELLPSIRELHKWQIPIMASLVEHAKPSSDDLHLIVQLMSSTGTVFTQNRDFGALLVGVANCLPDNSATLSAQLKFMADNYKGPLKFKLLKLLRDAE